MKLKLAGLVLIAAAIAPSAHAISQVSSMKDVLMGALNSKSGSAEAFVVGQLADKIRAQIQKPDAKVLAKAVVLAPLPQEDCKVVEVIFTTPGTKLRTPSGDMRELDMRMKFNVCKNGTLLTNAEAH